MRRPHDTLTTTRLAARRFTPGDLDLLVRLHSDPEVMRYTGGVLTREQSAALLRDRFLGYYEEHPGLGIWLTFERATGTPIGMHLLNHMRGESLIQVGYLLYREYWGRGYATEMAARVLAHGFTELGLPEIHGITDLPNLASQRVLLKIGLRREGERHFPAYGPDLQAYFRLDAASWRAQHA